MFNGAGNDQSPKQNAIIRAMNGHTEVQGGDDEYTSDVQIPHLDSAESLADFKRILSDSDEDATVQISGVAKKEFVAVDMHSGTAIVVSTKAFRNNSPLYQTYIRDLERQHIRIREFADAGEEAIAGIYERAQRKRSGSVSESSKAIGFFRDVIEAATDYGASDVHFEVRDWRAEAEIRFRVDGDLYTYKWVPREVITRSLSAVYQDLVLKNTNSANAFQTTVAQSANIQLTLARATLNLRWQSDPQVDGYDLVLRIADGDVLNYKAKLRMPETMGLEKSQLKIINSLGNISGGVVILSGETGSAKSTLLRALAYMVVGREMMKQHAISMPTEFPMPWLSEQSVPRQADETEDEFKRKVAEMIRVKMRSDTDDLTIGEILDSAVAGLVVELALTGHPVRTTTHANGMMGVYMRLVGDRLRMAIDEVGSDQVIAAVANQKLIPLLCPDCKIVAREVMDPEIQEILESKFGLDVSTMYCRDEDGCPTCRKKGLFTRLGKVSGGTKGQTLAMEIYRPEPEFLDRILLKDWRGAERVWRAGRTTGFDNPDMTGKTIYEHALYKASQGIIDPLFIHHAMKGFDVYRVQPIAGA